MSLERGQIVLDRYRVKSLLGKGGMGEVYLGLHDRLDFPVAIKILNGGDPTFPARFEREARIMARIRHHNVVSILDFGWLDDRTPCIIMDYVEGDSLKERIEAMGAIPWVDTLDLLQGLLSGLEVIHDASVLHRDLKPSNVIVAHGDPETAKLIDFGIAKPLIDDATQLTQSGQLMGTPGYMAPERLMEKPADNRSDLYSVGFILFEMLTGLRPFPGDTLEAVVKRAMYAAPPAKAPAGLPQLPDSLIHLLAVSLDINPDVRPQTAREFLLAVRDILRGRSPVFQAPSKETEGVGGKVDRAGSPGEPETGVLVVASLPPSRLTNPDERRWLAELATRDGKALILGSRYWMVVMPPGRQMAQLKRSTEHVVSALRDRYGSTVVVDYRYIGQDFSLTAAQLTGADRLPEEVLDLMGRLDDTASQ